MSTTQSIFVLLKLQEKLTVHEYAAGGAGNELNPPSPRSTPFPSFHTLNPNYLTLSLAVFSRGFRSRRGNSYAFVYFNMEIGQMLNNTNAIVLLITKICDCITPGFLL